MAKISMDCIGSLTDLEITVLLEKFKTKKFTEVNEMDHFDFDQFLSENYDWAILPEEIDVKEFMDEIEKRQGEEKAKKNNEDNKRKNEDYYKNRKRQGKGDGTGRAHNPEGAAPLIFGFSVNWMQSQWWLVLFFGVLLAVFWKGKVFLGNLG
jgi:hypothetical protein